MQKSKQVALFVTCLVDQIMPEVGVATVRLLQDAGYQVEFPERQTCCGQPFFNSGLRAEARRLAEHTVDTFAEHETVVLPSGSCTTMIRSEYPHLLAENPRYAYRARRLASRTYELSEFLIHQADWRPGSLDEPSPAQGDVTYHDSCHMCRTLGLKEEPRTLLKRTGYRLREMATPDRCCGFGGLFSIRMPEVSNAMTAEKLAQAQVTGAEMLITADPGCLMQMRGMVAGSDLQVEHLATALVRATEEPNE